MNAPRLLALALLPACGLWAGPAADAVEAGAAPDFTLTGVDGATYHLADQRGKTVVLEWYNPDCPFVKAAHGEGGVLHDRGNQRAEAGVVWWAINSGAPGKQGHGAERNQASLAEYGIQYPVLLDPDGAVGKAYGATTTPHLFVIDPAGAIAYQGAVDNAPLGDSKGAEPVVYVDQALDAVLAGKAPPVAATRPYGCSVKY